MHSKHCPCTVLTTGYGPVDVIQPPAPPLNPQSTIYLHMPASDLTCFDPPSPSQPTPAPPAMSARSHHALPPPRTTRCRPIRASPDITRPLIHRPMPIMKKRKNTVGLLRRPPPEQSSSAIPQQCLAADLTETSTDSCRHDRLYCPPEHHHRLIIAEGQL